MVTTRNLRQTVTYWAPGAPNDYGVATFATPVRMAGRWEDKQELIRTVRGDELVSKARVFTELDVQPDGYLALGEFVDANPPPEALEIKAFGKIPDLRNATSERRAYL